GGLGFLERLVGGVWVALFGRVSRIHCHAGLYGSEKECTEEAVVKRWRYLRGMVEGDQSGCVVCRGGCGGGDGGGLGLSLVGVYEEHWRALYGRARSRGHGHEDGCDLVQGFFLELHRGGVLAGYDSRLGGVGTYVHMLFSRYAAKEERRMRCWKRGGRVEWVYLDDAGEWEGVDSALIEEETPERELERVSARALLFRVMARGGDWSAYRLLVAGKGKGCWAASGSHAMLRRRSRGAMRAAACRARRRAMRELRRALLEELAGVRDMEEEIRQLVAAFG
ncbi:MAG: hypothetical protein ACO34E_18575, partial [Limisphaerales bacterium]